MSRLLITSVFPPITGGSGRWFWEIYRRLSREEYVIAAAQAERAAEFDRGHGVRVVRTPLTLSRWGLRSVAGVRGYWKAVRAVGRVIRREGVMQIHCGACLPDGWIGHVCSRLYGIPYLCYMHGEELCYAGASRELGWMARRVLGGADAIIANSENTRRILLDSWLLPDEKIRVLHPGVDTERFRPTARNAAVRERLGWGERPVVLTVGRLQKRKGHDRMIEAVARIRESVPDVLYAICGEGEEGEHLRRLAAELGLTRHVQFLGDVTDEELVSCYQQCDLFVLPNRQIGSDIEGFGMVLVEAQACGKPVIAGDSGGTGETMDIPVTGLRVNCDGPEKLSQVVAELLADQSRRERMGAAARERVVAQFDWSALADEAAAIFEAERSKAIRRKPAAAVVG